MKKQMIGLLLAGGAVTSAHAQNSVTLYGLIDEGVNYTSNVNGHSAWEMSSGIVQGSRWGIKGGEDLGGGFKAVFRLENSFDVNTGRLNQGGREFGRQAYVGLSKDGVGTLTFGRQYDSLVEFLGPLTANGSWGGFIFDHPYGNDNTDNFFRLDNAVQFYSADLSGFQMSATYAFSNSAGQFSLNNAQSVGAGYSNGPLTVGIGYLNVNRGGANTVGAVTTDDAGFLAERQRVFGAGINYQLGKAMLGFVYTHSDMKNPTSFQYISGSIVPAGQAVSHLKFHNYEVAATYQVTPALLLGAMYYYTQGSLDASGGKSRPHWQTVGLMADYNLSKRTDVYIQGSYMKVNGSTGTALDHAYNPAADDSSSNDRQLMARIGIRHKF
ncbi:porin [Burkholderia stabilis]|uniref:Porin n=1 Tax=Burkholderia stabilis TaxID=95485 RepID=A0A4Q2AQX1_9BURK|nr:porin [Burkholderia stabilis]RXV71780.1 porin [Burkholderia stabilis]